MGDKILQELVKTRNERIQTIREAQFELQGAEDEIRNMLIRHEMFDMFTINWRKINRAVFDKSTRRTK